MKEKMLLAHMKAAQAYAECSSAKRRQVGCVIVRDDSIIGIGYNGTPEGWDNCCEDENGITKPEVIHAEQNAMDKIMRSTNSSAGADVFVTTMPCFSCAMRLHGGRVRAVYYRDAYRNTDGIDFLLKVGIEVHQIDQKSHPD